MATELADIGPRAPPAIRKGRLPSEAALAVFCLGDEAVGPTGAGRRDYDCNY